MRQIIATLLLLFSGVSLASSKYVYNVSRNEVVLDNGADIVRSIASVTKLMTAIVILDSNLDLSEKVPYKGRWFSKNVTRDDLLQIMLVKSDNQAAEYLAMSYPGGRSTFITMMNIKADQLKMYSTSFVDPSGIGSGNKSTARDLTTLLQHTYSYDNIRHITSTSSYNIKVNNKQKKKERYVTVNNTNRNLLNEFEEIQISKTGTTTAAGKCLVMFLVRDGQHYAVVILGERNRQSVENISRSIIRSL
jgi:D-alanyl-D-alanine endopeptidase (penicillin-binding protein 7)